MTEKQIEQALVQKVKAIGGIAPKFVSPGFDGMPDRIVLFPGGHIAFVEVKAPGKKPRAIQTARHVEADSSGETEAGTTQRDVVRFGVHTISVSFTVTAKWLKKLTAYKQQSKIVVEFFDMETAETASAEMYISSYKSKREADSSYGGLWNVSFTLKEF